MFHAQFDSTRMYGLTHTIDGREIIREPKLVKVSIGMPKGKAAMVWTERNANGGVDWRLSTGYKQGDVKAWRFPDRSACEAAYAKAVQAAPDCPYPRKISWFTFTRPTADGNYEPDFGAIEAHGPMPTEIDIVFMADDPFTGEFAMWSAAELKCHGNGVDAERVISMATAEQAEQARIAKDAGLKMFPIQQACWTLDCPYSKPEQRGGKEYPSPCKPSGDLKFQLVSKLRVGGTAFFHTTGFRSISQIFSALYRFKMLTGGMLIGIPFQMVMRPYKTNHNGQVATQYGVSLELRAESIDGLRKKMIEQAFTVRRQIAPAPALLPAADGTDNGGIDEDLDDTREQATAAAIAAEFYPESSAPQEPAAQEKQDSAKAKRSTSARTDALKERLKQASEPKPSESTEATEPGPVEPQPADDGSWL